LTSADVALLKVGRHFRINGSKVIIGRDHRENDRLRSLADDRFTLLEPALVPGPLGVCETDDPETVGLAASVVTRYSDSNGQDVEIRVWTRGEESKIMASPVEPEQVGALRIGGGPSLIVMEQCGPVR
jgi:tRNA-specific 2-thiouridylase